MGQLLTPPETMQLLVDNGFRFYKSCNCHGAYWEKFKKKGGYVVKIAPLIDLYNVPGLKIGGPIAELATTIPSLI